MRLPKDPLEILMVPAPEQSHPSLSVSFQSGRLEAKSQYRVRGSLAAGAQQYRVPYLKCNRETRPVLEF